MLSTHWFYLFVLVFLFVGALVATNVWSRSVRQRFVRGRSPLTNERFVSAITANADERVYVVAIRKVLGRMCDVPCNLLRAEDNPKELARMMVDGQMDGWCEGLFLEWLEEELNLFFEPGTHVRLPEFVFESWLVKRGPATLREWIIEVVAFLKSQKTQRHESP